MIKKTQVIVVFILFLIFQSLSGQEGENGKIAVAESLAKTADGESKHLALDNLKEMLLQGASGQDLDRIISLLGILANEGVTTISYDGKKDGPSFPDVRIRAASLLGRTGDAKGMEPLINIIFYDQDARVIKAAVEASSSLPRDDKGKLILAYSRILKNTRLVFNDEELIQITLRALLAQNERDDSFLADEGIKDGLDFVAQPIAGYGRNTRELAQEMITLSAAASRKETAP